MFKYMEMSFLNDGKSPTGPPCKYFWNRHQDGLFYFYFILLDLPTRAGSPQQRKPITVGPFLPNPPCQLSLWEETGVPGENPRLRQSVDFLLFSHEDWVRVALRMYLVRFEPAASEVKGKCANHLATVAPYSRLQWHFFLTIFTYIFHIYKSTGVT